MTDWHCHILPGIDDGPADMDESLAMARALAAAGYRRVCCTPHAIRGVYDNRPDGVREAVAALQQQIRKSGIDLSLYPGMEYYLDEFLLSSANDLLLLPGNLLLVEIPGRAAPSFVSDILYQLCRKKLTPLIAHPERCALLDVPQPNGNGLLRRLGGAIAARFGNLPDQPSLSLLDTLCAFGCKFQGDLGSFAGFYGERVRRKAEKFLAAGIYSHFGSDMHSVRQSDILAVRQRLP